MKTLTELMNQYGSDKGTDPATFWAHGYSEQYAQMFEPIRDKPLRMLEIGVCDPRMPGASLKAWYDYFPNAQIFGFDIVSAKEFDNDRITTFQGDQSSRASFNEFISKHGGGFDIIIDDGSHQDDHQQITLGRMFQHVRPDGWYIIEDLHASPGTTAFLKKFNTTHRDLRRTEVQSRYILPEEYEYVCAHAKVYALTDKLAVFRR